MNKGRIHVVIGDTQVKQGVPIDHLGWIGRYVVDQFAGQDIAVVHTGDHFDMPSLSSYDQGKKEMEGKRYVKDIAAGRRAFDLLNEPLHAYNSKRRTKWLPQRYFLMGNHEDRISRAAESNAQLDGLVTIDDVGECLFEHAWKPVPFLEILDLDGIWYSHYFYNPNTGRPYAGENIQLRLKTIGHSFTMGHQQGCNYGHRAVGRIRHHGLVLGSTYLHDERYLGPQGNDCWRGIVVCHQVENGMYDPMFVSLEYLCRRYTGKTLKQWSRGKKVLA